MNITPQADPMKILLVEDNPADVEMARVVLEESGLKYTLEVAEDGEEALSFLTAQGRFKDAKIPDLILLDINLPKLSGKEVLQSIRKNEKLKNIPIMVLTSSHAKSDITDFYHLEADYYLTKPLDAEELKSALGFNADGTEWPIS